MWKHTPRPADSNGHNEDAELEVGVVGENKDPVGDTEDQADEEGDADNGTADTDAVTMRMGQHVGRGRVRP
jgi:hypothetical protein